MEYLILTLFIMSCGNNPNNIIDDKNISKNQNKNKIIYSIELNDDLKNKMIAKVVELHLEEMKDDIKMIKSSAPQLILSDKLSEFIKFKYKIFLWNK